MAANTVTITQLAWNTAVVFPTPSANDPTAGTLIKPTRGSERTIIYMENTDSSNAEKVTIAAGEGYGAYDAITIDIAKSAKMLLAVESARYMQDDGYIHVQAYEADGTTASDDVKFAVICNP